MQVNREWWSGTERYIYAENLIGADPIITTIGSLNTAIRADLSKFESVKWDKSICPWKIHHNSDFFKLQWDNNYFTSGDTLVVTQAPFFKDRRKGYTFYLSAVGGEAQFQPHENYVWWASTKPQYLNCLSRSGIDLENATVSQWILEKYGYNFPVVDFNYSRIFTAVMIHDTDGRGHLLSEDDRSGWNAAGVFGVSVMFFCKSENNSNTYALCASIISLNNEIQAPPWTTTNCWKDDLMFDNGLAVTSSLMESGWSGYSCYGLQTLGTNCKWFSGDVNPGFDSTHMAGDDAAGSVYFFPAKNIPVDNPAADEPDSVWSDQWESFYAGGGYPYGIKRHLKSTVSFDEFLSYIKQQLAYLGFRFCADANHLSDAIDSQYFYIPEIDSNGVTTGNYAAANAPEAENYINYTWTDDVYESTPYDGTDDDDDEGDPNNYDPDNETVLNSHRDAAKNYFFNTYAVSPTQLRQLSEYMYTEMPTNKASDDFLTNNPIDCIISLQLFPISFDTGSSPVDKIMLGKVKPQYWDENTSSWKDILAINLSSQIKVVDCGSCTYYPKYGINDFRNYEPYCTAEIELPYCGNVKIPTSVYLNHTLNVKYIVDLVTGACIALVYRDKLAYLSITGQIGASIPVSGIQSLDLQSSVMRKQTQYSESLLNVAKTVFSAPTAIASGGANAVVDLASSYNQLEQSEYNLEHVQVPFTMHGSSSPLTSFANEQYPRLIVKRPLMLPEYDAEKYAHLIGFACNITGELSEFSGYTLCASADTSGIAATIREQQLIKEMLLSGIYL